MPSPGSVSSIKKESVAKIINKFKSNLRGDTPLEYLQRFDKKDEGLISISILIKVNLY